MFYDIKFIVFFNMNFIYGDNFIFLIMISGKLFIDFLKVVFRLKKLGNIFVYDDFNFVN